MFKSTPFVQSEMEFVCIEQLVPKNHLLRKINQHINFSFIRDLTKDLYCPDNGRPCLDPVILFKMVFIGYLFGIRSERRLIKEIEVNVAYRWFLGFGLTDKVPDASTISQNRRRRFNGTSVFQDFFDAIVLQAVQKQLIDGKTIFSDSTHLKANANKNKFTRKQVTVSIKSYLDELDKDVAKDREDHGKKPLPPAPPKEEEKEIRVNTTDPDSGFLVRDEKSKEFCYLDHRTVDGKLNLIIDTFVTPGNVHDSVPLVGRIDRVMKRFGLPVEAIALDAGYLTASICHELHKRNVFTVIGHRRFHPTQGLFPKWKFTYQPDSNTYVCPAGQMLRYSTTNREGFREYKSKSSICAECSLRSQCTHSANNIKVVTRHVWEDSKEWVRSNRLSPEGKELYKRRKETIERSFADSKELHGLRYARFRGLSKVGEQCLLTALCQNIKKMANYLCRGTTPKTDGNGPFSGILSCLQHLLPTISSRICYAG